MFVFDKFFFSRRRAHFSDNFNQFNVILIQGKGSVQCQRVVICFKWNGPPQIAPLGFSWKLAVQNSDRVTLGW